jgi:hypothetical protein
MKTMTTSLHRSLVGPAMAALAMGLLPALAAAAPAAPSSGDTAAARAAAVRDMAPVTVSLRDAPLRTALETLFQGTGLQHAVEPAVPNYPITLDIREVPFSTALRTMLRLAPGVTYRKEGDIYVVGMRQPQVEQTSVGQDIQQPDQTQAVAEQQWEKLPLQFTHDMVIGSVLGAVPIPTEDQVGTGGGYGGGLGGYGGGLGGGFGGSGYGGGGLGGFGGGGLGGFGGGGLGGFGGGGLGGFGGGGYGGGGYGGGGYGGGGYGGSGAGFYGPTVRRY